MSDDFVVGTIFAGRYRIERRIAAGGMGAVYEVVHLETNRRRALKVMHPDFVQNEESRDRFRQEARIAAQIESDYIVDTFDAGIDETTQMPYLVMELLQGEEISRRIRRLGRLAAQDAVLYLHQAGLALDKTHRSRIVHRDLKPDNLYLCEREDGPPRIKLLDFGIAKMVAENAASANATQAVGTPLYMAPEQFLVDSAVSPATDLYALAMIAYTMLVGQTYWHDESKKGANVFAFAAYATLGPQEAATVRAQRNGVTLPAGFDAWFVRATSKNIADRFPTAGAMITALSEALGLPPPMALMAGAYTANAAQSVVAPTENDRASVLPRAPAPTLLGSANTTNTANAIPDGDPRRKAILGGVAGVVVVAALLYWVFATGPSATQAVQPLPTDSAAASSGLPQVMPVASTTSTASTLEPASAASTASTLGPPTTATAAPSAAPAPTTTTTTTTKPKGTTAPTGTVKKRWVRD